MSVLIQIMLGIGAIAVISLVGFLILCGDDK